MKRKKLFFLKRMAITILLFVGFLLNGFSQTVSFDLYGLILPWSEGNVVPVMNKLSIKKVGANYKITAVGPESNSNDTLIDANLKFIEYIDWAEVYSYNGSVNIEGNEYDCTVETFYKISDFIKYKKCNEDSFFYKKEYQIKLYYWKSNQSAFTQKSISIFPVCN